MCESMCNHQLHQTISYRAFKVSIIHIDFNHFDERAVPIIEMQKYILAGEIVLPVHSLHEPIRLWDGQIEPTHQLEPQAVQIIPSLNDDSIGQPVIQTEALHSHLYR